MPAVLKRSDSEVVNVSADILASVHVPCVVGVECTKTVVAAQVAEPVDFGPGMINCVPLHENAHRRADAGVFTNAPQDIVSGPRNFHPVVDFVRCV